MSLIQQMEELQKKANSYDNLAEEFERLKAGIGEIMAILTDLMKTTKISIGTKARTKGTKAFALELYERLKIEDGLQLTNAMIESEIIKKGATHNTAGITYILDKLPGIVKVRDSKSVIRLYYEKTKDSTIKEKLPKIEKVSVMG